MKIISWNIAGIRATLKKDHFQKFIEESDFDIICFQETKADEDQVKLSEKICQIFPYRFWNSNPGITQRKGFSGTAIWSKIKPIVCLPTPDFDTEGRITTLEFEKFILITVYTPNSQSIDSERFVFRIKNWDVNFREYINSQNNLKPTIVCGDLNVAHLDIDIHNPIKYKNKVAGFLDEEREGFSKYLDDGFIDAFRSLYPDEKNKYTYWNQIRKTCREKNIGWRIDYFLVANKLKSFVKECEILHDEYGSDHCPISLTIDPKQPLLY